MNRKIERIYPYAAATISAFGFYYFKLDFPKGQDILSATITIGAIFTGFLATSKSLVISIDTPAMNKLRETSFFPLLIQYLREALYTSLLLGAFGILGFFTDSSCPPKLYGIIWTILIVATFLTFYRVTSAFLDLIKIK